MSQMQKSNRLRMAFKDDGRPSFGLWQMLPGNNVSRALARANVDWIMVDCEHGNIDGEHHMAYLLRLLRQACFRCSIVDNK